MKKFIISTLLIFLFISCREESEVIYFTADELIAYCQNNMNCDKDLKKKKIEVTGKVAWISYPKDGLILDECIINLETTGCDVKKRSGSYITCKISERITNIFSGQEIKIIGLFNGHNIFFDYRYNIESHNVSLKRGKIIQVDK